MGDHSSEPVDETMSGNIFHCKNKRPCQVINFIVRTSKKYILFVCLVMYLKIRLVAREMYNSI